MAEPVMISALTTDVLDDEFFNITAPDANASARTLIKNRMQVSQRLLTSKYVTATSITTRVSIAGQLYILYVSLT